jgi:hypothetical protein
VPDLRAGALVRGPEHRPVAATDPSRSRNSSGGRGSYRGWG